MKKKKNAPSPMQVTVSGILIIIKKIFFNCFGIVFKFNDERSQNAPLPIFSTDFGNYSFV